MNPSIDNHEKKYAEGHFVGIWMMLGIAICSGVGVPLSFITKNFGFLGFGPAIGVAVGLAVGQSIENKYRKEGRIRPLTEAEKRKRIMAITVGIALLTLGVLSFLLMYFR